MGLGVNISYTINIAPAQPLSAGLRSTLAQHVARRVGQVLSLGRYNGAMGKAAFRSESLDESLKVLGSVTQIVDFDDCRGLSKLRETAILSP